MCNKKPLILITNDDGVFSPGIKAAVAAVADMADIVIAAPHTQQTGMGRAFVRNSETGIIDEVEIEADGCVRKAYGVHGTPAFAVAHGILELADRRPDLCISGINYGENPSTVLTCSGTLGAAFESVTHGIPAIAVSVEADIKVQRSNEFHEMDFTYAANILRIWAKKVLTEGMPSNTEILNINVPSGTENKDEYRITVQSRQNYFEFVKPEKRDLKKAYALKTEIRVDLDTLEKDSDIYAVYVDRIASVTPLNTNMSVRL